MVVWGSPEWLGCSRLARTHGDGRNVVSLVLVVTAATRLGRRGDSGAVRATSGCPAPRVVPRKPATAVTDVRDAARPPPTPQGSAVFQPQPSCLKLTPLHDRLGGRRLTPRAPNTPCTCVLHVDAWSITLRGRACYRPPQRVRRLVAPPAAPRGGLTTAGRSPLGLFFLVNPVRLHIAHFNLDPPKTVLVRCGRGRKCCCFPARARDPNQYQG